MPSFQKSSHPSGAFASVARFIPAPTRPAAASISPRSAASSAHSASFTRANRNRYSRSCALSMWLPGIASAPSLCSPTIAIQNS